jgi:hypothetical protein
MGLGHMILTDKILNISQKPTLVAFFISMFNYCFWQFTIYKKKITTYLQHLPGQPSARRLQQKESLSPSS